MPAAPPEYVPSRTVVFLMALHRIEGLVGDLTTHGPENIAASHDTNVGVDSPVAQEQEQAPPGPQSRTLWPLSTPCAVIERASCPDQRVIRTTLAYVTAAIEEEGSRPPGLLVLGAACEVLVKPDGKGGRKWTVEEGFKGLEWAESLGDLEMGGVGDAGVSGVPGVPGKEIGA